MKFKLSFISKKGEDDTVATKIKKEEEKKRVLHVCTYCSDSAKSESTLKSKFYSTNHKFIKDKRTPLCKKCIVSLSTIESHLSISKFKDVLEYVDKPFLGNILESSIKEAKGAKDILDDEMLLYHSDEVIGKYFKNIGMHQYSKLNYSDSDKNDNKYDYQNEMGDDDIVITDKIRKFWGKGFEDWEYEFLEEDIFRLKTSFDCKDYGMEMILKDVSFMNLSIAKERLKGNDPLKLIESRTKLMDKGKLNPVQQTGADANEQITFGTLIQKLENERPVGDTREEWKDPDNFNFWSTIFAGHLAKMNDLSGTTVDDYEEIIKPYTVERKLDGDE